MTTENTAKAMAIFGSQALGLGMRFLSNVLLARVLMPDDFGIATVVLTTLNGVFLFTDVGIQDSIVRHENGATKDFVETAQTLLLLRAILVYAVIFFLAPFFEGFYDIDGLALYLRIAGLHLVVGGFSSLRMIVQRRRMNVLPTIYIELISQIVSIVFMVTLAYIYQNVWPLILSALVMTIVAVCIEQVYRPNPIRFSGLHKKYAKDILTFGIWILFSTLFNYLIINSDRLILAKISDVTFTGLFNLGSMLASIVFMVGSALFIRLVYPLAADHFRANLAGSDIDSSLEKTLRGFFPLALSSSLLLFVLSPLFFRLLYPDVYHVSGSYSQVMVLVYWVMMMYLMLNMIITAFRRPGLASVFAALTATLRIGLCIGGYHLYGIYGFMAGLGLGSIIGTIVLYTWLRVNAALKLRYCLEVTIVFFIFVIIYYVFAEVFKEDRNLYEWVSAGVVCVGAAAYLCKIYGEQALTFIRARQENS